MPQTFWSHTIWFIILGIVTLIQISLILIKASDKRHIIALFLITAGSAFIIELVIYCFFQVYEYYPMLFPHSPIDDGLAGNLFSQFSLTSTALMIAVYQLKFRWMAIFAGIYFCIEELFLYLGIYKHNFYSSWLTFLAILLILFPVTKQIYLHRAIYTKIPLLRYLFMFLGLFTLHMPTALWIQIITGIMKPNTKLFSNDMHSYAFVCLLNLLLLSVVCTFTYFSTLRTTLKLLITMVLYVILFIAKQYHFIYIKEGWFVLSTSINIFAMYLYIWILDRLMTEHANIPIKEE